VKRSARTIDIVYRFDPAHPLRRPVPRTSAEALRRLLRGNRAFAGLVDARPGRPPVIWLDADDVGHGVEPGKAPAQRPFAAVLGCSDARVPTEMVFQERSNDLFVVRIAGNGLDNGCIGSLRYAEDHFSDSLRLVVVLGHSRCGAVTAAVDAFLAPKSYLPLASNYPLRAIVDSILVAVRTASLALEAAHADGVTSRPGYRAALVETTSILNAALAAYALREELETRTCRVVFGVYDLTTRFVGVPRGSAHRAAPRSPELLPPPRSHGQLRRLAMEVAGSRRVRSLLDPSSGPTTG
jgi:carbonic anhydrase